MGIYWEGFVALYTLNFLNLISPGAGCALTVRNAGLYSLKIGVITGLGICLSSYFHKSFSILMGSVLNDYRWLMTPLKCVGAFYLCYLGYKCWVEALKPQLQVQTVGGGGVSSDINDESAEQGISNGKAFRMGFFTDLLNPQASFVFFAIVEATLQPTPGLGLKLGIVHILIATSVVWYVVLAAFFSTPKIQEQFVKYSSVINILTGTLMIYFGISLGVLSTVKAAYAAVVGVFV